MLRLRFASGVTLGLVVGLPTGVLLGLWMPPPVTPSHDQAADLRIQELTRRLEAAARDRERVDRQIEQFQKLAEQMTASFNSLEQRFKALAEEQRAREARVSQSAAQARLPQAAPPADASAPTAETQEFEASSGTAHERGAGTPEPGAEPPAAETP